MHAEYTTLMSSVLDREATAEESARLQQHLTDCRECSEIWHRWQAIDVRLSVAPMAVPPDGFVTNVMARLNEKREEKLRKRWLASGLLLAWGATISALWLIMGALVWWGLTHPFEVSLMKQSGAQALGSFVLVARGIDSLLITLRGTSLPLALGCVACLAVAVSLLWVWIMACSSQWKHGGVSATGSHQGE